MRKKKSSTAYILSVSAVHLIHDIYAAFFAPVIPILVEKLSLNYTSIGIISAARTLPSFFNPLLGKLLDKWQTRVFLVISPIVTSVMMSLIGYANSAYALFFILLISGFSSSLFHLQGPPSIRAVSGNKVGRGMSWFMFGGELSRTLVPLVILYAVSLWSLEGVYRLIPFSILASGYMLFILKKYPAKKPDRSELMKKLPKGEKKLLTELFVIIIGIVLFRALIKSSLVLYLPSYVYELETNLWQGGIALSVLQLAGAAGALLAGNFSDKFNERTALLIITILTPISLIFFFITSGVMFFFVLIMIGLTLFATNPILLSLINKINTGKAGYMNGIYFMISHLISALTVILVSLLGDKLGLHSMMILSCFVSLGSIPFAAYLTIKNKNVKNKSV